MDRGLDGVQAVCQQLIPADVRIAAHQVPFSDEDVWITMFEDQFVM